MGGRSIKICETLDIVETDDAPHTKCMGLAVLGDLNFLTVKLLMRQCIHHCFD